MTTLKIGDKAPEFNALDENETSISLSDFSGKKVVLYFYPKDMTPGCTIESCNLAENYDTLISKGFVVIGVSPDSYSSHKKFIEKYNLPFPLIADLNKTLINDYKVWGPKKFMGKNYEGVHRTTFVIDEDGLIERIFNKVNTKQHAQQILDTF